MVAENRTIPREAHHSSHPPLCLSRGDDAMVPTQLSRFALASDISPGCPRSDPASKRYWIEAHTAWVIFHRMAADTKRLLHETSGENEIKTNGRTMATAVHSYDMGNLVRNMGDSKWRGSTWNNDSSYPSTDTTAGTQPGAQQNLCITRIHENSSSSFTRRGPRDSDATTPTDEKELAGHGWSSNPKKM